MDEFYKKHRPKTIKGFFGNTEAKALLGGWVRAKAVPHCLLFQGPSGCGKTTLARILRSKLDCGDGDFKEINAAGKARGIDEVKTIESQMSMSALSGASRVYLIDEAHKMTNDAQNAILKMLEDTPRHVYFMLATTDPNKLINTIKTRCSVVTVKPLTAPEMAKLISKVAMMEDVDLTEDLLDAIVAAADGSARKALVLLNQVAYVDPDKRMELVNKEDERAEAIELCRLLMNPRIKWPQVAAVIKRIEDLEPESFRYMMLAYASSVCLGGGKLASRAFVILDQFSSNYYDSKRAGLIADCYEVVHGRQSE